MAESKQAETGLKMCKYH